MTQDDPIKHVIVLMLENNSFDHILGSVTQVKRLDGIYPNSSFVNSYSGTDFPETPKDSRVVTPDPNHESF